MESWPASGIKSPASQRAGKKVAWPSGLRRWFKAPVSSEAWVRIPPLPNHVFFFSFLTLCAHGAYGLPDQPGILVAKWSRGMIPALGAGGPGFKSPFGPCFLVC